MPYGNIDFGKNIISGIWLVEFLTFNEKSEKLKWNFIAHGHIAMGLYLKYNHLICEN